MPHHQPRLASLLQWTAMVVSSFNSRAHSNVVHGVAKSGLQLPEVKALLTAVAEVALRSGLEGWAPQALSNLIWAYATARVRVDALFAAVEREVASSPRGLDSYEAQNLSNLAWAYATAGVQADSLYAAIADAALRRKLRGFSPQNLSNIVWAYATAGRRTDSLFSSTAAAVTAHAAQDGLYEYQARTNPGPPLSVALVSPPALAASPRPRTPSAPLLFDFDARPRGSRRTTAARAARSRCSPSPLAPAPALAHADQAQNISNLAWAYATVGFRADALFTALADAAVGRDLHGFLPQNLSNMVWAFAMAGVFAANLFNAVAAVLRSGLPGFKPQELSNLVWAYATAGVQADELYAAVAEAALRQGLQDFKPQEASNLAWAFATSGVRSQALFAALAEAVLRDGLQGFVPQALVNIVWAYATLGIEANELFLAVARMAVRPGSPALSRPRCTLCNATPPLADCQPSARRAPRAASVLPAGAHRAA